MKKLLLIIVLLFSFTFGYSQTNPRSEKVHSYHKKNGEEVKSHYRTAPNKTKRDNYSHKGNTNPHTGKRGTKK